MTDAPSKSDLHGSYLMHNSLFLPHVGVVACRFTRSLTRSRLGSYRSKASLNKSFDKVKVDQKRGAAAIMFL